MKYEDLFNDAFLELFKTGAKLTDFLKEIQKCGIEKMLEAKLNGHLDYWKHQNSSVSSSGKGYSKKKVKISFWESEIVASRDWGASFDPMVVPKRGNTIDGMENVVKYSIPSE